MTLHPLVGHEVLRHSLVGAIERASLPGALMLYGPSGSGKQRFAQWIASALVCEALTPEGPCGECRSCRMAVKLEHPDIHWYFPLPRPKGSMSKERLEGALEDARWETLEQIRQDPLKMPRSDQPEGLYLAAIQSLRRRAIQRPTMGARQVFIIGRAEALVPQESSPEAANALLKILEEPPEGTTLILTTSRPRRVLPTLRSRSLPIHVPPLSFEATERFLMESLEADPEDAARAARLSGGSLGRAVDFLPQGEDDGALEGIRKEAFRLFRAGLEGGLGGQFASAVAFPPSKARAILPTLEALEVWVRDGAAASAGCPDAIVNQDARSYLTEKVPPGSIRPDALARALSAVDEARRQASGNVNPQLIVHGLIHALRRELGGARPALSPVGAERHHSGPAGRRRT